MSHRAEPFRRRAAWFLSYLVKCNVQGPSTRSRRGEVSILAAVAAAVVRSLRRFRFVEQVSSKKIVWEYIDQNRKGDQICYISDLSKVKAHYPSWEHPKSLDGIFFEVHRTWLAR